MNLGDEIGPTPVKFLNLGGSEVLEVVSNLFTTFLVLREVNGDGGSYITVKGVGRNNFGQLGIASDVICK